MPRTTDHTKRLGEQLDNANARIKELEALNARLEADLMTARLHDDHKYQEILNVLGGLRSAFSFHMDTNTMAVNALSANIANLVNKVK